MSHLAFSLLGTFQIAKEGQILTNFRSANVQGLLVYLALQVERPFPREVLASLFWPEVPDKVALTNLRQSLYQLRKVIGNEDGHNQPYLHITRQSVQFNQQADVECDVWRFNTAVTESDFDTAVTLYQGELLPGFTCNSLLFEEWLLATRETLHRQALDLFLKATEKRLQAGEYSQARYLAQQQLLLEPWREEAHRQLMQALVLNGERSAALAQYETCCQILQEEFGTEPEAATLALYERILAGDDKVLFAQTAVTSFLPTLPKPHNLPTHVTPFFNREEAQSLLLERIPQPDFRLITLVGEGGIGKSRLAQEVGRQSQEHFQDGVWFVPLAGLAESNDETRLQDNIATAVAQTIRLPLQGQKPPREQLFSFLRQRKLLLLLDNFEHVLAGSDLVLALLEQAPDVSVICTSRQPLNFMAEWTLPLEQLSLPPPVGNETLVSETAVSTNLNEYPAIQLFVDRAARVDGRFALTKENEQQVVQVCRLVAGLPLALELAAASLRQRPLPDLINSIQQTIDTLTTQYRDIPERHRSMRAVFNNSWVLLNGTEQALFARLSAFRGGFTAVAAQAVTGADAAQLQALVDKSLLQVANGRYEMHDLLRQFAIEKCAELGLAESTANQHSHYFLTFVAEQSEALAGETPQAPATLIAADLDNVRQGWETAVDNKAADLILAALPALADLYQIRGLYQEGVRLFSQAAETFNEDTDSTICAHLRTQQAGLLVRLAAYQPAISLIQDALPTAEQSGESWLHGRLHITWGEALWRQGNLDQAENHLQQALQIAEVHQYLPLMGFANFHLGVVADYRGQHEDALAYLEKAQTIWQQTGNRRQQGFTLNSIGVVTQHLPEKDRADSAFNEALQISQENNDLQGQSMALNNLSLLATETRKFDSAKAYLLQALQLVQFTGDEHGQALVMYNLGWNAMEAGWIGEAEKSAELALKIFRVIGSQTGEGKALSLLGDLAKINGRVEDARDYYQSALRLSQVIGDPQSEAEVRSSLEELA